MSWTIGTTVKDSRTDLSSPPPTARIVILNWPSGVRALVATVIVDENEGFADTRANNISVAAGAPWEDMITGTEMPDTSVTENRTELFDPRTCVRFS
jgi:hypothetical protein